MSNNIRVFQEISTTAIEKHFKNNSIEFVPKLEIDYNINVSLKEERIKGIIEIKTAKLEVEVKTIETNSRLTFNLCEETKNRIDKWASVEHNTRQIYQKIEGELWILAYEKFTALNIISYIQS